jgi:hypothetical protein
MYFDFRFKNAAGKWESRGHRKGVDRDTALRSLGDAGDGLPPGRYMSRPRGRQKDWDLFSLDGEGQITTTPRRHGGATSA